MLPISRSFVVVLPILWRQTGCQHLGIPLLLEQADHGQELESGQNPAIGPADGGVGGGILFKNS